ncbi:hydrogenase nickel insertion protein HypA [Halothece sp. PCC 7418]|uniref:hydrogenase maturation nickel metallochaperone HypA n=1 Tax=Halothece sp. (strain PCC 7418) TaxID=65093 RepID=UPI0002A07D36|nr:hydrogenase maturation nickel metallochaperone HypA [Halothece sp. PCC 7418]AFZ43476.1 hydrogenase nickel insertion protein HypA [Halothece sp. PCC 7418]
MHEVGIMEQLLAIAIEHANAEGANEIHSIKVKVGDLSGVVPEALTFAFDVTAKGTIAQSASFEIEQVPAQCYCPTCQQQFTPSDWIHECPHCHQISHDIRQGKELELVSLEIS